MNVAGLSNVNDPELAGTVKDFNLQRQVCLAFKLMIQPDTVGTTTISAVVTYCCMF
jgi:hypothetical protein